jgi:uncharacterized protein
MLCSQSTPFYVPCARRAFLCAGLVPALLCPTITLTQDLRGSKVAEPSSADQSPGNYYALVIGINEYPDLPHLTTAVHDAQTVGTLLESNLGFSGHVTYQLNHNATRASIMAALQGPKGYAQTLTESDNLLIYYAGHGYFDKRAEKAYWLPFDAESELSANRISADDLTTAIRGIASHHVLIISDSCYSGDLTRGTDDVLSTPGGETGFIRRMRAAPSRTLLSSGGNEPVADGGQDGHSIFAAALLRALSAQSGDSFTAADLARPVQEMVRAHSDQVPEYMRIGNSMPRSFPIDIGDFVFTRKVLPASAESERSKGEAFWKAGNYPDALEAFNTACNGGDAESCNDLGALYSTGNGAAKDFARAAKFYRKACDGGFLAGCNTLGWLYLVGWGVTKDYAQSAALVRKACDGGFAEGCGALGAIYQNGMGVTPDFVEAASLLRRACDGGDNEGCANLGALYSGGKGVAQDFAQAAVLYRKSCDGGFWGGCANLGKLYSNGNGVAKDPAQAEKLLTGACNGGFAPACSDLGFLYANAIGVARDFAQAADLFRKACDGGVPAGCANLGLSYADGKGVAKDPAQAAAFFRKACDGGFAPACDRLKQNKP